MNMTVEKALTLFNRILGNREDHGADKRALHCTADEFLDAVELAVKALEKQVEE